MAPARAYADTRTPLGGSLCACTLWGSVQLPTPARPRPEVSELWKQNHRNCYLTRNPPHTRVKVSPDPCTH